MPQPNRAERRERRGFLILIGLILAGAAVFNVDLIAGLGQDRIDLVAVLPDASGVRIGTAVWVAGVESGSVTSISFLPGGDTVEVAVGVRVDGEAGEVIRSDSDVRSTRLRLIGEPIVQVMAGSAAGAPVSDGDTLRAQPRLDPASVLARGRHLPAAVESLFASAGTVRARVEARGASFERLERQMSDVTVQATQLSADLERGSLARLTGDPALGTRVDALRARLTELSRAVSEALERYSPAPGADGDALGARLASLRSRAEALSAQLDTLSGRLERGSGLLPRMREDSALQVAIRATRAQIDSLRVEAQSIALRMILP